MFSTSATSSGSSALVISSSSSTRGCIASARTIATRCCCPPERRSGYSFALVGEADALEQRHRARLRVVLAVPEHPHRSERDVLQHRHVREEVEALEHDADLAAHLVDVDADVGDAVAVDRDRPAVDRLEQVDAAEQRRLPRSGRADEAHDLVLVHRHVDAAEHPVVAEPLLDVFDLEVRAHRVRPHPLLVALHEVVDDDRERDRDDDVRDRHARDRREVEAVRRDDAGPVERVEQADEADERGVLLQADEVVEQRRDDAAHRLRHDDEPHRLGVGETERAGARRLAPVDALDAGAVHLGDVRAVDERERDHAQPEHGTRSRTTGRSVRGSAEHDQVDDDDGGQGAEEVDVRDGEEADRRRRRARAGRAGSR